MLGSNILCFVHPHGGVSIGRVESETDSDYTVSALAGLSVENERVVMHPIWQGVYDGLSEVTIPKNKVTVFTPYQVTIDRYHEHVKYMEQRRDMVAGEEGE